MKRNRGRRGLDILNKIDKELAVKVQITEEDFPDVDEVDSKLVRLAQHINGQIITNDFNLNKVAQLQGSRFSISMTLPMLSNLLYCRAKRWWSRSSRKARNLARG